MPRTKGSKLVRVSKSQKTWPSSDCRLQLACMKPESLVIAGQHTAVNVFLSLVHTARQATKVGGIRRGTCGWITSFLKDSNCVGGDANRLQIVETVLVPARGHVVRSNPRGKL